MERKKSTSYRNYRHLLPNEADLINKVMVDKGITQLELAKRVGFRFSQAHVSVLLMGNKGLRNDQAIKIYEVLDNDPSINFLNDWNEENVTKKLESYGGDTEQAWSNLYTSYFQKVLSLTKKNPEIRPILISDLEILIRKYESKK